MTNEIDRFEVRYLSGLDVIYPSGLPFLKEGSYDVLRKTIPGDAPKQFIRVYEHGYAYKSNRRNWPRFIAKGGQKSYPNESITEHFITRLGQLLQLNVADSRLYWARDQIRFLSRYFLKREEILVHGVEIFAGYLSNDRAFVESVEQKKQAHQIFTFQVVEACLKELYPPYATAILEDFVRLLAFDAIVGNNDRHYVNWGVITSLSGKRPVVLAPIYDTARALLWNKTEAALETWEESGNIRVAVRSYAAGSRPKIGWTTVRA